VTLHPDLPRNKAEESGRAAQKRRDMLWCCPISPYFTGNSCCLYQSLKNSSNVVIKETSADKKVQRALSFGSCDWSSVVGLKQPQLETKVNPNLTGRTGCTFCGGLEPVLQHPGPE